jgi:hypothetical protein
MEEESVVQGFGDPMTKATDHLKPYSGSPACASESNAAMLKGPLKRVAILAFGWSLMLGGIIGLFLPIVPGGDSYSCRGPHADSPMRVAAASNREVSCAISRSESFGSIVVCSITMAEVRR